MADAYTGVVRYNEVRDVYGSIAPVSGTKTIQSVSVTLKDSAGAVAGGVDATAITQANNGGFTPGADRAPEAWFTFSAAALALPVPTKFTNYEMHFVITDTQGRAWEPVTVITLAP